MAPKSIFQGTSKSYCGVNNRRIIATKKYYLLRGYNQNNWILKNRGPFRLISLQCYEILWMSDIDANNISFDKRGLNFFNVSCLESQSIKFCLILSSHICTLLLNLEMIK